MVKWKMYREDLTTERGRKIIKKKEERKEDEIRARISKTLMWPHIIIYIKLHIIYRPL